jgi:hypothetical protein
MDLHTDIMPIKTPPPSQQQQQQPRVDKEVVKALKADQFSYLHRTSARQQQQQQRRRTSEEEPRATAASARTATPGDSARQTLVTAE